MAEERGTFTLRELMRKRGYIIQLPEEPREREALVAIRPAEEPQAPVGEAAEVKKRLDALVMRMVRELREEHGDIMLLSDFVASVIEAYEREHGELVSVDDVLDSVADLTGKGLLAGVATLGSGARIIRLSPEEFGLDELRVLEVASRRTPPELTLEELIRETGWPQARARAALEALERARVARRIPGSFTEGVQEKWVFPGLEKKLKA